MDFKFDVSQIPVIPIIDQLTVVTRREGSATDTESSNNTRSSINEFVANGWKKPQLSQVREVQLFFICCFPLYRIQYKLLLGKNTWSAGEFVDLIRTESWASKESFRKYCC